MGQTRRRPAIERLTVALWRGLLWLNRRWPGLTAAVLSSYLWLARRWLRIRSRVWPRRLTGERRRCVAGHEAGHAVVGYLVLAGIERVSIVPRGEAEGRTVPILLERRDNPEDYPRALVRARLLGAVTMAVAGFAAQERMANPTQLPIARRPALLWDMLAGGAMDDLAQAWLYAATWHFLADLPIPLSLDEPTIAAATEFAEAILTSTWPAVEAVAHELEEHGETDGARLEAIMLGIPGLDIPRARANASSQLLPGAGEGLGGDPTPEDTGQ